eukprot:gene8254-9819_t
MFEREKKYEPPVEREPTPFRSDSYHSLMTPEVAKLVFARYDKDIKGTSKGFIENPTDLERDIKENPTLGTTPEKELIITKATQMLTDFRIEERYRLRKARLFYCCIFCNVSGLTLTLYSLSLTVIFEQFDSNPAAFYCSLLFYIPALVWFAYVYLPLKKERERRKRIHLAVKIRKHYKNVQESYFYGHEDSDEEELNNAEKALAKNKSKMSGTFSKDGRSSSFNSSKVIPSNNNSTNAPLRVSIEMPKAPARSSIKKVTGEKKASVQFKLPKK